MKKITFSKQSDFITSNLMNLIILSTMFILSGTITVSAQSWFNGNWHFRKSHAINATTGAGTNYQVQITVNYGSGADATDNIYCNSLCKTDFSDIRFTSSDGTTLLSHWIQSYTSSSSATFWVKVSADLSSAQTIYVYYCNSGATDISNGSSTFIYYDDGSSNAGWTGSQAFGNATLGTSTTLGNPANSLTAIANQVSTVYMKRDLGSSYGPNTYTSFNVNTVTGNLGNFYFLTNASGTGQFYRLDARGAGIYSGFAATTGFAEASWNPPGPPQISSPNTWYKLGIAVTSSTSATLYYQASTSTNPDVSGSSLGSYPITSNGTYIAIHGDAVDNASLTYWDNIIVRKYVTPEPANSGWGAQEVGGNNVYLWNGTTTDWQLAANWTPTRTTPSVSDILYFNSGLTQSVTNVPDQTVAQIILNGATTINLSAASSLNTLTVTDGLSTSSSSVINLGTGVRLAGALAALNNDGTIQTAMLTTTSTTPIPTGETWGGTINYNGVAQTGMPGTYNNLIISGTGQKTFATTPTVNGTLSMEGTGSILVSAGVVTYGSSATLQYNKTTSYTATSEEWITPFIATGGIKIKNTGAITIPGAVQIGNNTSVPLNINGGILTPGANLITLHGDFINTGTLTSGSGGVTIAGTTTSQSIDGFTTTGTVSMTKTAGTATLNGNVNGGAFTINGTGGTLNLGTGLTHTFTGTWTRTNGTVDGASSTLNLGGSLSGTGGTFTASSGTVNYNAAGAQTAAAVTYNNLTLSGSGLKTTATVTVNGTLSIEGTVTVSVAPTFGTFSTLQFNGTTRTTTNTEWPATFGGTGGVKIIGSSAVTLNAAKTITYNLSIGTGSTLILGTGLTSSATFLYLGGVMQTSGTSYGSTASAAVNKINLYFVNTTGILNVAACTGNWTGFTSTDWNTSSNWCSGVVPTSATNVVIPVVVNQPVIGAAAVCNNITINTGASLTVTGSNTLTVSGNWTNNGTFTANSSTVIFNGATPTIAGATTFNNATIQGSGAKTITTANFIVNGILSMEATGTLSTAPTYGASATLQYNTSTGRTSGAEWISPFAATGGVIISNSGAISMGAAKVFNDNIPLTINTGSTLTPGANLLTLGGNFTINGTGAFTSGSGGVTITGATTQTISGFTTTGNLSMTKTSGTAAISGAISAVNLTVNGSGGTLNLGGSNTFSGTRTLTAGTLILANTAALGASGTALALNGGTLDLMTNTSVNGYNVTVGGAATITSDRSSTGAGITHTLGTLSIGNFQLNTTAGANVTSGTAGLVFGATTLSAATPIFNIASGVDVTLGALTGNFAFTKQNNGQLILSSASARTSGNVTLTAGSLTLGSTSALGTTGVALQLNGGTLNLNIDSPVNAYNTTVAGTVTIASGRANPGTAITHTLGTLSINYQTLSVAAGSNVSGGTAGLTFGTTTLSAVPIFDVANGANLTLGSLGGNFSFSQQNTGTLTLTGAANANRTGGTVTVTDGKMEMGAAVNALGTSAVTLALDGGTFSTGSSTGFTNTNGLLKIVDNSTISLGTGSHTLTFAASNGVSWTAGKILTINGWLGGYNGTSGTSGKLFVGASATGLTVTQLTQIQFFRTSNSTYYPATILSSGEVVPTTDYIITGTIVGSPFCAGTSAISVPFIYSLASDFPGATFTAQLSSSAGSFAAPTNLQTIASDASGSQSISVTIPAVTTGGTLYRIRVVSNTPAVNGSDNGSNITINALPQGSLSGNTVCSGGTGQFTFTSTSGTGPFTLIINGTSYSGVVSGTPFNASPNPGSTTSYTLTSITDANGCVRTTGITGASAAITINPLPQGNLTANGPFCAGGTGQFTFTSSSGTGPFTLIINGTSYPGVISGTAFNASPNPGSTTAYTLTSITDANGCVRTTSISGPSATITVNPLPQGSLVGNSVCPGGTGQFTYTSSSGTGPFTLIINGTSYSGVLSGTAFNASPNPSSTTAYTLTSITDANGCARTTGITGASATITVNSVPTTTNATVCIGGSGSVTASATCPTLPGQTDGPNFPGTGADITGVGTITWSNPSRVTANDNSYTTVAVNGTTSHYLKATNYGFSIPANATVTGIQVTIGRFENNTGGGADVRDNVVSLVNGSGTITGNNKAVTGTDWPTSETALTYGATNDTWGASLTATDINSSNFGVVLSVNSNNNRTGSVDYIQITITYTDNGTLTWYTVSSGGSSIGTGSPFNPVGVPSSGLANTNTAGTTPYYVECSTSITGCRAQADFIINPLPQGSLSANGPFCSGGTGQFTYTSTSGTGPFTLIINGTSYSGIVSGTAFNASPNPGSTTAYILTSITDANGCVRTTSITGASATITVNPLPQGSLSGNTVCSGGTGQFTYTSTSGTGPFTLIINGTSYPGVVSGTAFNASPNPGSTTAYTLTSITDANGCVRTTSITGASATITVNPLPQGSLSGNTVCSGGTGQFTYTSTSGTGPFTLVINGTSYPGVVSGTAFNASPNPGSTTAYTLTSITDANGCVRTTGITGASATITVNPLPQGSLSGNTVCSGGTGQFTYTSTSGTGPFTLIINGTSYSGVVSGTAFNASPNPGSTTAYTLTSITDANGCVRITSITGASATITVNPLPQGSLFGNTVCSGGTGQFTFTSTTGTGPFTLIINGTSYPGVVSGTAFNASPNPGSTTSYTLTSITDANGCVRTTSITGASATITVNPLPQGSLSGNTVCSGGTGQFTYSSTSGTGPFTLIINGTSYPGVVSGTAFNASPNPGSTTAYTLTSITDANGCIRTTSITGASATITVSQTPTVANAGPDQTNVATCGLTTVTLAANTAITGTGQWSIISGSGGSFSGGIGNPTNSSIIDPTFSGNAGTSYVLRWTISNPPCTASISDVTITFNQNPATSNAGSNQTICTSGGILSANTPGVGTGAWSISSGPSTNLSQFNSLSNPSATFTPDGGAGTYTLVWTISNSPCTASSSSVTITVVSGGTWLGTTSTDWFDAGNWCGGLPTSATNVIIPSGPVNQPVIGGTGAVCNSLTINGSAGLTMNGSGDLTVSGNWTNNGTFISGSGLVSFAGSSQQNISGTNTFDNLTVNNVSGVLLNNNIIVNTILQLDNGTITTGSNTVTIENGGVAIITNGFVNGNMKEYVPTGQGISLYYPIGTGTDYTPLDLFLYNVTNSGYLTVNSTAGDNSNIGSSGFNSSYTVNRNWNITNGGVVVDQYDAGMQYAATDEDGSFNSNYTGVKLYNGSWFDYGAGYNGGGYEYITAVTSFGSLQIGQINPTPSLYSITPAQGGQGQTLDVVFDGAGFINGISSVNTGAGITVNSITVNSEFMITANITISGGATLGSRNFSVTNATPNGGTSSSETFIVTAAMPVADFAASSTTIACYASGSVQFTNLSTGATSYSWNFGSGASPATATGAGPYTVSYSTAGLKTVTLTATNMNGSDVETKTNYITVSSTVPGSPGSISGPSALCTLLQTNLNYVCSSATDADSYTWTVPAGATLVSGQGTTAIVVNYLFGFTSGNVTVQAVNACGSGIVLTLGVSASTPATPAPVSGPVNVCGLTSAFYSVPAVGGAASYNWTTPSGMTILSGQGTNSIHVSISGMVPGNVTVQAMSPCGNSGITSLAVTKYPAVPGTISGPGSVCSLTSATYSVSPVTGATAYSWIIPSGMTVIGSATGPTINVTIVSSFAFGQVKVTAMNSCGSAAGTPLSVYGTPTAPVTVTGPVNVCGMSTASYTCSASTGAISYTWTLPAGMNPIGSATGTTINVSISGTVSGSLSAKANSPCASSTNRTLAIVSTATQPGPVSGLTDICGLTTANYSIAAVAGAVSYVWTLSPGVTGASTGTSIALTFAPSVVNATIKVASVNSCGNTSAQTLIYLSRYVSPGGISGNAEACTNTVETYCVNRQAGITYYWSVVGGSLSAQTLTLTTSCVNVTWDGTAGSGTVKVNGTNSCGRSPDKILAVNKSNCISPISVENSEAAKSSLFNLYPNPTSADFTVDVTSTTDQDLVIEVYDVLGNQVINEKHSVTAGINSLKTTIENFRNGLYFVRVVDVNSNTLYTQTLTKQ